MQGYKGAAPEPQQRRHQSKGQGFNRAAVVRAVVDCATQRAALLLADSSCLLVSLSAGSQVAPVLVPAPCTDACFLRLQAYEPVGAAVSKTGIGSPLRLGLGEIGQGESPTSRVQELLREKLARGNGKGRASGLARALRRELFVVTARPGKGGSCTDLRAWSCIDGPGFTCAEIELEHGQGRVRATQHLQSGRVFARLDAPHGLAIKMAASINALVVYSSSAGI